VDVDEAVTWCLSYQKSYKYWLTHICYYKYVQLPHFIFMLLLINTILKDNFL
jgi:hypothetical protein